MISHGFPFSINFGGAGRCKSVQEADLEGILGAVDMVVKKSSPVVIQTVELIDAFGKDFGNVVDIPSYQSLIPFS